VKLNVRRIRLKLKINSRKITEMRLKQPRNSKMIRRMLLMMSMVKRARKMKNKRRNQRRDQ
jgi:hypothetical protein